MKMYLLKPYGNDVCKLFIYETVTLLEILNFESKVKMSNGEVALVSNLKLFMTLKDAAEHVRENLGV